MYGEKGIDEDTSTTYLYELVLQYQVGSRHDALHMGAPTWTSETYGHYASLDQAVRTGEQQQEGDRFYVRLVPSVQSARTNPRACAHDNVVFPVAGPPPVAKPRFCRCCNALSVSPWHGQCAQCPRQEGTGLCINCARHLYTVDNSRVPSLSLCCLCALSAKNMAGAPCDSNLLRPRTCLEAFPQEEDSRLQKRARTKASVMRAKQSA